MKKLKKVDECFGCVGAVYEGRYYENGCLAMGKRDVKLREYEFEETEVKAIDVHSLEPKKKHSYHQKLNPSTEMEVIEEGENLALVRTNTDALGVAVRCWAQRYGDDLIYKGPCEEDQLSWHFQKGYTKVWIFRTTIR